MSNNFYSYEPNCEFREHIGDIIRDLEGRILMSHPIEWNNIIKEWFRKNFEQYHIKTSIDSRLIKFNNTESIELEEYQDKHAIYKLADGLIEGSVFKTKLDYPRDEYGDIIHDHHKEKTHSILVMKNRKK